MSASSEPGPVVNNCGRGVHEVVVILSSRFLDHSNHHLHFFYHSSTLVAGKNSQLGDKVAQVIFLPKKGDCRSRKRSGGAGGRGNGSCSEDFS